MVRPREISVNKQDRKNTSLSSWSLQINGRDKYIYMGHATRLVGF